MPHPIFTDDLLDAALGPDRALPRHAVRPLRWFHAAPLEALFRAPWWSPYAVYAPVVAWLGAGLSLARPAVAAAAFGAGWLTWTLLEYLLHRVVFHWTPRGDVGRVVTWMLHRHHHRRPSDADHLVATPLQSASLLAPVALAVDGAPEGRWATLGLLTGYLVYEAVHRQLHHGPPTWLAARRRAHDAHHHIDPSTNFGISTALWDHVFGTRR